MLFAIKILAAYAYYWFFNQLAYQANSDTIRYFHISLQEKDWFLQDPLAFIKDLFTTSYEKPGAFFGTEQSYWNNLKDNVFIKMLALCNLLTNSSYFADAVIFNLIYFIGPVLLFKMMNAKKIFKIIPPEMQQYYENNGIKLKAFKEIPQFVHFDLAKTIGCFLLKR